MAYFLVRTAIDHGFTDPAIVQATSAEQAHNTMTELASLFGYSVESVTQVSKAEAMNMIREYKAHGLRAVKNPRVKLAPTSTSTATEQNAEPLKPEQQQQIKTAVSQMDDDGLKLFLNYISFLYVLDQQPKLS